MDRMHPTAHDRAWAAGERYQGKLAMLAREARSRYRMAMEAQTYYDAAICARLGRALDSGDLIAEAEVRAYAFAFGFREPDQT